MEKIKCRVRIKMEDDKTIVSRDMELPIDLHAFEMARMDLEEEIFIENGYECDVVFITALENADVVNSYGKLLKIGIGDVIYRDWDDEYGISEFDREKILKLISEYKPLWGGGAGWGFLSELLNPDIL